uniref:C2H2-type domain-containing protein n=1 Tax=Mycena chlorophos TaxID=658473 RepID=A0ABQ0LNI1_MYCCL|nr:predicted protein [Mycena chlorophos]
MPSPQSNHLSPPLQMINITQLAPCPYTTMSTEIPRSRPERESVLGMFQDGSEAAYGREYRSPSSTGDWFALGGPSSGWPAYTEQEHDSPEEAVRSPNILPPEDLAEEDRAASSHPSIQMFSAASGFSIDRSEFLNVQGNIHIHPQPQPQLDPTELVQQALIHLQEALGNYIPATDPANYCSQMQHQGRGFPIYMPNPQSRLPDQYQQKGIGIGDVGRITPDGVFDFFFNIFLEKDHPINANHVPDNFIPCTSDCLDQITEFNYDPGDCVLTRSVSDYGAPDALFPGSNFLFHYGGVKGAVLALPHGAAVRKLESLQVIEEYINQYAQDWYKYLKGPPYSRKLENGSLLVVTGHETTCSWGMASYKDQNLILDHNLAFRPTESAISYWKYRWLRSPLIKHKFSDVAFNAEGNILNNQTTFIHAFTVSLGQQGSVLASDMAPVQEIFNPSKQLNDFLSQAVPDSLVLITHSEAWRNILIEPRGQPWTADLQYMELDSRPQEITNPLSDWNNIYRPSNLTQDIDNLSEYSEFPSPQPIIQDLDEFNPNSVLKHSRSQPSLRNAQSFEASTFLPEQEVNFWTLSPQIDKKLLSEDILPGFSADESIYSDVLSGLLSSPASSSRPSLSSPGSFMSSLSPSSIDIYSLPPSPGFASSAQALQEDNDSPSIVDASASGIPSSQLYSELPRSSGYSPLAPIAARSNRGDSTGTKRFVCQYCGGSFTAKHNLNLHVLGHTASKLHKCERCGIDFWTPQVLKRHQWTCTGPRPSVAMLGNTPTIEEVETED